MSELRPLSKVCVTITDGTHYTPIDVGNGIPFLTVKDMTPSGLDFQNCSQISRDDFLIAKQGNSAPKAGDVLFSKDGTVGKVQLVTSDNEFAVLSSIAILRPDSTQLYAPYLAHALKSEGILNSALKKKTGSAIRRIILSDLKTISIPLPPLVEQQRIAVILDKAEGIKRKREQAIAKLDELAQSTFVEMFGDPFKNTKNWT
jgi:type I restriction enzyme S subunit